MYCIQRDIYLNSDTPFIARWMKGQISTDLINSYNYTWPTSGFITDY